MGPLRLIEIEDGEAPGACGAVDARVLRAGIRRTPADPGGDDLAEKGVTGTMGFAWAAGDPKFDPVEAKVDAMNAFADVFIRR